MVQRLFRHIYLLLARFNIFSYPISGVLSSQSSFVVKIHVFNLTVVFSTYLSCFQVNTTNLLKVHYINPLRILFLKRLLHHKSGFTLSIVIYKTLKKLLDLLLFEGSYLMRPEDRAQGSKNLLRKQNVLLLSPNRFRSLSGKYTVFLRKVYGVRKYTVLENR